MLKAFVLGFLLIALGCCLYDENSAVVKLTERNFKDLVLMSDEYWLVEFYAPWCGHCKKAAPEFKQAAEILLGVVNLGALDMTTDGAAGHKYGVSGYPTFKFFAADKDKPLDFKSNERTYDKFVEFCMDHVRSEIDRRTKAPKVSAEDL